MGLAMWHIHESLHLYCRHTIRVSDEVLPGSFLSQLSANMPWYNKDGPNAWIPAPTWETQEKLQFLASAS